MFKSYKYHFYILLSGLSFASLSLFLTALTKQGVDAFSQLFYRALFASFFSFIGTKFLLKQRLKINRRELKYLFANAIILIGGFCTMVLAIYFGTPIAKALAIVYTYPITLVVLTFLFFRELPTRKNWLAIIISIFSLGLLIEVWKINDLNKITIGEIMAFLNSICYSFIIIFGRVMKKEIKLGSLSTLFYSLLIFLPLLVLLGFALNFSGISVLTPHFGSLSKPISWLFLILLGLIGTTCSVGFLYAGISKVKPFIAGVLLLMEPVGASLLGYFLFGQTLSIWGYSRNGRNTCFSFTGIID